MVITSIRPDVEWYNVKINPFFTLHPTLDHFFYLFELTMFPRWAWNTLFIATVSTGISLFCGLLARVRDGVDTAWCPLPCREDQRLVRVTRGGTVSLRRPAASALTSSTRPHRPWRPVHPARTSRRTRRPRQQLFRPPGSGCRPRAGWRRSVSTAGGWGHPGRRGPGTPWWDGGRGPPSTPYPWPLGCCPAACRPCARA